MVHRRVILPKTFSEDWNYFLVSSAFRKIGITSQFLPLFERLEVFSSIFHFSEDWKYFPVSSAFRKIEIIFRFLPLFGRLKVFSGFFHISEDWNYFPIFSTLWKIGSIFQKGFSIFFWKSENTWSKAEKSSCFCQKKMPSETCCKPWFLTTYDYCTLFSVD